MEADQGDARQPRRQRRPPTARGTAQAITAFVATCLHRIATQPAADVVGQRQRTRIALAGIACSGQRHDAVQVAAQLPLQRIDRHPASLRDGPRAFRRIAAQARERDGHPRIVIRPRQSARQHAHQQAELVHIAGGGDRPALLLLGRGPGRGHRLGLGVLAFVVEQAGDAEVEQLGTACVVHQDVRRLDVAMHDQLPMRVIHRIARLGQQFHPSRKGGVMRIAPCGDVRTAHQLHR